VERIRTFFSHSVFLINILCVIWLALCLMSSIVSPQNVKNLQLFSLTFPFAITANIFFIFFWIFSSRRLRLVPSLLILAASYNVIPAVFGLHFLYQNDWAAREGTFKVMSWNTHAMGIFNVPFEKKHASGIVAYIKAQDPDILVLPEFSVAAITHKSKYKDQIIRNGRYKAHYFTSDNGLGPDILIGTAIFSRYPIINYQAVFLDSFIAISYSDVVLPTHDTTRIFAVHLHTFGLSDNDKSYIEDVKNRDAKGIVKSRSFLWKFNNAYSMRAAEADKVAGFITDSPYPVIVAGDFNDLPFSYSYTTIRGDLSDAFASKGRGFGRTYNQIIPTLRIDHILYDADQFRITAFRTPYVDLSDHSPILTRFRIAKRGAKG
jgi:endonuclease/exonuclease/phosphatase (EEP) superfamily protein YafD